MGKNKIYRAAKQIGSNFFLPSTNLPRHLPCKCGVNGSSLIGAGLRSNETIDFRYAIFFRQSQ